jgi:hypothetical protein
LQQTRAKETEQLGNVNKRLKARLREIKGQLADAVSERDEMRDAIVELVEKGD